MLLVKPATWKGPYSAFWFEPLLDNAGYVEHPEVVRKRRHRKKRALPPQRYPLAGSIRCDLQPVATKLHAAPAAGALLAGIVEMQHAASPRLLFYLYTIVTNDSAASARVRDAFERYFTKSRVVEGQPSSASEDFRLLRFRGTHAR